MYLRLNGLSTISLLLILFLLQACGVEEEVTPAAVETVAPTEVATENMNLDDQFLLIAEELPGFAGLFIDADGNYVVNTANISASATSSIQNTSTDEIKDVIEDVMGDDLFVSNTLEEVHTEQNTDSPYLEMAVVKYSFEQLSEWFELALNVIDNEDFVFLDIDEVENKIAIGLKNEKVATAVKNTMKASGVPTDALYVEITQPFQPLARRELDQYQRDIPGGLGIEFRRGGGYPNCSMAFNVRRNGVQGFLTASHCSLKQGETDFGKYYQGRSSAPGGDSGFIGTERVDPPPTRCGLFNKDICRNSDAVFVRYDNPGISGKNTLPIIESRPNNKVYDNRFFRVISNSEQRSIVSGMELSKIGERTGWSEGKVDKTCFMATQDQSKLGAVPWRLVCNHRVRAYDNFDAADGGDSGGAVYRNYSSGPVPAGVLWGGSVEKNYFIFCGINQLQNDLGVLDYTP